MFGTTKDLRSSQKTLIGWAIKTTAGILRPPKDGGLRMTEVGNRQSSFVN